MRTYEYACTACQTLYFSSIRDNRIEDYCNVCEATTTWQRIWSVQIAPVLHEHFNRAVDKPVSSRRQFREDLKRASEDATLNTGIEHNYVPTE